MIPGPLSQVVPRQQPGAMGATYHPPGTVLSPEQVAALRCRPADQRRALPSVGDVVGWRRTHGGPVVAARVHSVDSLTDPHAHEREPFEPHGPDMAVWRVRTNPLTAAPVYGPDGGYLYDLVEDPWPQVVLRVDPVREGDSVKGATEYTVTREARLDGSAGWLPASEIGR